MVQLLWLIGCAGKRETPPTTETPDPTDPADTDPPAVDSGTTPGDSGDSGATATEPTGLDATGLWTGPCADYVTPYDFLGFQTQLSLTDEGGDLSGTLVMYQYYASVPSSETSYSAYGYTVRGTRDGATVTLDPTSKTGGFDRIRFDLALDGDALTGTATWAQPVDATIPCDLTR